MTRKSGELVPTSGYSILQRGHAIVAAWHDLAHHGTECAQCCEVVDALSRGILKPPPERLESLCEEGQVFAGVWIERCEAQRARFRQLARPWEAIVPIRDAYHEPDPAPVGPGLCRYCGKPLTQRQIDEGKDHYECWRRHGK